MKIVISTLFIFTIFLGCNKSSNNEHEKDKQILLDSIKRLNDSIKALEIESINKIPDTQREKDFKDFAVEFHNLSLKSKIDFINFCEPTLLTFDYEKEKNINQNPDKSYEYIIYYLKQGKMKIANKIITFSVPEGPDYDMECVLYFRLNDSKEWKLFKYRMPA